MSFFNENFELLKLGTSKRQNHKFQKLELKTWCAFVRNPMNLWIARLIDGPCKFQLLKLDMNDDKFSKFQKLKLKPKP